MTLLHRYSSVKSAANAAVIRTLAYDENVKKSRLAGHNRQRFETR